MAENFSNRFGTATGAMLIALSVLTACTRPKPVVLPPPAPVATPKPPPPAYAAPADMSAKDRMVRIIRLLEEGNAEHARIDLRAYLFQNPNSKLGNSFLEQIDRGPDALFGEAFFNYEVKANQTLSELAERFLGDRYKFWALARYNGIASPIKIVAGQKLRIPGVPKPDPQTAKSLAADEEEIARRLAEEQQEKKDAATKAEPVKPVSVIDPIRAMALRKIGLENLQRGKIDAAIAMLKQAMDMALGTPSLAVIQKDLARALQLKDRLKR
jgi:tetratricopeptide (TPR) repeat protein